MSKIKVDTITTKDGSGELTIDNSVKIKESSAPAQESGYGKLYVDSTSKNLKYLDSNDNTVDLTASSTGLTSLGGLTGATQTFGDDTNVTMVSSGTAHTLTWSGTLSHERGGLESDVSSHNGLVKISGGSTTAVTDNSSNWDDAYTHSQADHAPASAEQNEYSFKTVVANATVGTPTNTGSVDIVATSDTDSLHIHAGSGITITHDADNRAIKIASASGTASGTVESVVGTGTVNGLTLTGTVTSTGNLTLGGTLAVDTSAINDDAVTYDKIQNMTTDRLLGRTSASPGVVEELTKSAVLGFLGVTDGADVTGSNTCNSPHVATNLDQTTATNQLTITSSTGDDVVIVEASDSIAGVMTVAHHDKLHGIASSATANDTDANLKNRANHTGTQLASTISDFDTQVATTAVLKGTANTMSAKIDMAKNTLDNARLQSYTEKTHTFTWDTSGDATIDLATGNVFVFNIESAKNITGFDVTNVVSDANTMQSFTIIINQPSSGTPGTIDFSTDEWSATDDTGTSKTGTLKWQGGVEPTESNAVSKTDMYTFWTVDNGNTFYGCVAGVGW